MDLLGSMELGGVWAAWASLGLVHRIVHTRLENAVGGGTFEGVPERKAFERRERDLAARAAIGVAYQATQEWSMRLGYEYLHGSAEDVRFQSSSEVRGLSGLSAISLVAIRSFSPAPRLPGRAQGWYAGLGGGAAWQQSHEAPLSPEFRGFGGFLITSRHSERRTPSWHALVGRELARHVAIEARYADHGEQDIAVVGIFAPAHPGAQTHTERFRRQVRGASLDVVARAPLGGRWEAWGSLGVARMRVDTRLRLEVARPFSETFELPYASRRTENTGRAAVGVQYRPAAHWTIRAGYEYLGRVGSSLAIKDPMTTGSSPISSATLSLIRVF